MKAIEEELITKTTKARLTELEAEEERIQESIYIEENKMPKLTKEQILFALERFRDLDITLEHNRERLVDALVKCIILYDDKIIITTTFKNEPITIMTTEEVAEVARLDSDIENIAPPEKLQLACKLEFFSYIRLRRVICTSA